MKKITKTVVGIICVLLLVWFVVSFIDIVLHNTTSGNSYGSWNVISQLFEKYSTCVL